MDMTYENFEQFWQAISVIEAQETLVAMSISDYPHLKQSSRQKHHKTIHKMAFPTWFQESSESVSPAQIIEHMTKKARASSGR